MVIGYTVAEAGQYAIQDSFLLRHYGAIGGSVHLRVLVNDRDVGPDLYCATRDKLPFDRELGKLAAGDNIYVCIGPGETDAQDSFGIDFAFVRFGLPDKLASTIGRNERYFFVSGI